MKKLLGVTTSPQKPLLNKIWNEEDIPQDWKVGILVKLPKKGDVCLCKNWRGVMLLTVASKVLCKIILERMKDALDGRLQVNKQDFIKRDPAVTRELQCRS